MTLDASVYCRCFEDGSMKSPPDPWQIEVCHETGCRELANAREYSLDEEIRFDDWNVTACDHEDGIAMHVFLGNITAVANIRGLLRSLMPPGSLLVEAVFYDGMHSGDQIKVDDLDPLRNEVAFVLPRLNDDGARFRPLLEKFEQLIGLALELPRPIVF